MEVNVMVCGAGFTVKLTGIVCGLLDALRSLTVMVAE
jgi:hypothetical protein